MFGFIDWLFVSSVIGIFLPPKLEQFLERHSQKLFSSLLRTNNTILIDEYDSHNKRNELFDSVQAYLRSNLLSSVRILKYSKTKDTEKPTFTMEFKQDVQDKFGDIPLEWSLSHYEMRTKNNTTRLVPRLTLSFHKKHRDTIQSDYLPKVLDEGDEIILRNRKRKIYSNSPSRCIHWSELPFLHPSNFDTLALDPALKDEIKADLGKFIERREFYSRVGRAWKRGYLLYGPPGTGKTSLIAAIANYLDFDVYDLELKAVKSNLELRDLLIATKSKSVIVVEDIDCSLQLSDRKEERGEHEVGDGSKVSLSGVLNFVDGLWSTWVGERLMIFTTNHKENIDPALLRAGRMDKHIHLGFCQFKAFQILAENYLGIDDHELMKEVEQVLPGAEMTPAEVTEIFMSCHDDVELGMKNALEEMKQQAVAVAKNKTEMEKKIEEEDVNRKRRRRR